MKIAIVNNTGFSERWVEYCEKNAIPFRIVDPYTNDIVEKISDCDAFMWHHSHTNYKDALFAKQLLYSIELNGKKVFPDFKTSWHFDDKVGQKYLLETLEAPIVPSFVFYDEKEAINWIDNTSFPKVFKLRGGAGAENVKLVKNKREAYRLVNKAFSKGFSQYDSWGSLKERFGKWKHGRMPFIHVLKGVIRLFIPTDYAKMHPREKGYVYFQEFIPQNQFDIRVIVTGNKAFAIKRMVREGDFRASGSGVILYNKAEIDERTVRIGFDINKKLRSQSLALDFVFDKNNNPLIVEMSYGYGVHAYDKCPGYWTDDMKWHEEEFNPQFWQIENIVKEISLQSIKKVDSMG